ncbi:MAG: hypothetical protein HY761_06215 [Candidatus Omnitrophica bacterium]|nr:hypothetical protein [Candidatus Omnitrophota bacterium]
MNFFQLFKLDSLNGFVVLAIGFFTVLALVYSSKFMQAKRGLVQYYLYMVITAICAIGAVLTNNLVLLLFFWGILGLTLYLLVNLGGEGANLAAKKTFVIVGGTDALMLLGISILYFLSGSIQMDEINISLTGNSSGLGLAAYLLIAAACFAKAGAMPFHSWIPDCADKAPLPVVAYLPAAVDKLLGIYLLARISLYLFVLSPAVNMFLMIAGAVTIIAAVMMALIQHNMKRLLGYHAVSQVGYMLLGIGTGTAVGIAGAIFHMLNNSIYKQCFFLAAGNVEQKTGTTELNKLGGLAKTMPITYISCLFASFSICGIPPFNGFVSKWMIYQGVIERLSSGFNGLIVAFCLVAAMFGSSLTLASFMKLIHAVFLGQRMNQQENKEISEVKWQMWMPPAILALICVVFGVFANQIPLRYFIQPILGNIVFSGWYAGVTTLIIMIALFSGVVIFYLNTKTVYRKDQAFVGGEALDSDAHAVTGTEFYNTVKDIGLMRMVYKKAEAGVFDIYEQGKKIFRVSDFLRFLHNGIMPTYLIWMLLGMLGLFFFLR